MMWLDTCLLSKHVKKFQIMWICVLFWSMSLSWLVYNVKYFHEDVPQRRVRMMQIASHGQHLPQALYTVLLMKEFVTNCSQEMFVITWSLFLNPWLKPTVRAMDWKKLWTVHVVKFCIFLWSILQLDTVNLNSQLFWTETYFPWFCPCFFSHLLLAALNSVIFNSSNFQLSLINPYSFRTSLLELNNNIQPCQDLSKYRWDYLLLLQTLKPLKYSVVSTSSVEKTASASVTWIIFWTTAISNYFSSPLRIQDSRGQLYMYIDLVSLLIKEDKMYFNLIGI